jgi:SEC-C motif-containing protein
MRSRYTAYTFKDVDYLLFTHDPETVAAVDRVSIVRWCSEATWLGLMVHAVEAGGAGDVDGVVEFSARWKRGQEQMVHLERSVFRKVDGQWFYVSGTAPRRSPARTEDRPGPNAPCPCGSGNKFKRCHGA